MTDKKSAQPSIKIAIADDHKVFVDALKFGLESDPSFQIVACAYNGEELMNLLVNNQPKILVLDLRMPIMDGWQVLNQMKSKFPSIPIAILTMDDSYQTILDAIHMGARAVLAKDTPLEELILAIKTINSGDFYFDGRSSKALHQAFLKDEKGKKRGLIDTRLTSREFDITLLICQGLTNTEISKEMELSVRTIESYRKNIFSKTNCRNAVELVIYSIKNNLIQF